MVAKKMEYEEAKVIKEKAALDKAFIHKDYIQNTLEVNRKIKEFKKRAKSISIHQEFARQ